MPVCGSVRSRTSEPDVQTLQNFQYTLPVAVAPIPFSRQCNILRTSGFVNDVMFSHNGLNGAIGKLFTVTHQVALGANSAVLQFPR